jgi:Ca2+-binding RTX toxin-like protein
LADPWWWHGCVPAGDSRPAVSQHDTICGGDHQDDIRGGDGNDWLDGGAGSDSLRGDSGRDTCIAWELRNSSCEF